MNGGLAKFGRYLLAGASAIGLLALGLPEAKAQNMQEIQAQINQMQATIKALQKQVQDAKAQAASAQTTADSAKGSDLDLKVKWKGAPQLSSADGKVLLQSPRASRDGLQPRQPGHGSPPSRMSRRRNCVGLVSASKASLFFDWKYVLEVDFANESVRREGCLSAISGFQDRDDPLIFRVGNFKTPNTFEDETSDRFVDTMERAAFINAWDIERQIGFMTAYYSDHLDLSAGIFGERFPSTARRAALPRLHRG